MTERRKERWFYSRIGQVSDGGTGSSLAAQARTNLGLAIGTNIQAWDNDLDDIAALTPTDSNIMVGNGTDWVKESGDTARISLGVGSSNSPQFTGIELGDATDTTITRVSAGVVAVEGVTLSTSGDLTTHAGLTTGTHGITGTIVGTSDSQTLTNKRHQPRVSSTASGDISPDVSAGDVYIRTAQTAALTINNPIGTPAEGERLTIRLKDDATARAISWGTYYRGLSSALPSTTVISKLLYMEFIFNSTEIKWDMIVVNQEA